MHFIHEKAIVEPGAQIGDKTRIWAYAHILGGARLGTDCNICDHTFIENDVVLGDRVTVKCGVYIWNAIEIQDDVFIGPNVTFTNDKYPRSKQYLEKNPRIVVCTGASIGANATILPGLRIGEWSMVGAGAVVTADVPPHAIVVGNPSRITGYVDAQSKIVGKSATEDIINGSKVSGVRLHRLNHVDDLRGDLCVAEWEKDMPFEPKRVFFVYNVPTSRVRGEHAHRICKQFLICLKGSIAVVVDNGSDREEFVLDHPWLGLYLPNGVWGIQYKFSRDAVLAVFASHAYDSSDYIRDYNKFLEFVRESKL